MSKAIQTGEPQLIGKDKQGRALYLEPPGQGGGAGWGGSGNYHQDPNARYVRPDYGYARPYGRRAGGGYGYPIGMGMNPMMMVGFSSPLFPLLSSSPFFILFVL